MGSVIQMRATSTGGTESGLASIDSPLDGLIEGVEWNVDTVYDTTLDKQLWQLSFGSVVALVNDSRQVISNLAVGNLILGAGGSAIAAGHMYTKLPDISVSMGERLFLHSFAAAGVVGSAYCCLHMSFNLDLPKARRR